MKKQNTAIWVTLLFWMWCNVLTLAAVPPVAPDQRDQEVLATVLTSFLTDPELDLSKSNGTTIVLNDTTPEKTGMIRAEQMSHDIGPGHKLPAEVQLDLVRRNEKPGSYESYLASFRELKLDKKIQVSKVKIDPWFPFDFKKSNPTARAWVSAWLPGYSSDGSRAVFRAMVGPWAHAAVVTVFLEKTGGKWTIKWRYVAYFV